MGLQERSIRVVGLLARAAGLAAARGLLRSRMPIEVVGLFTHRRRPRGEDPAQAERPEYREYLALARELGLPLHTVDSGEEAARLEGLAACRPLDVLVSVNWRYLVPPEFLAWAELAPINLHRGRLPDYAGAEPVRRALEAGEKTVTLTAHMMTAECDAGPVLVVHECAVDALRGPNLGDDVERIKRELLPQYPRVAIEAIKRVRAGVPAGL